MIPTRVSAVSILQRNIFIALMTGLGVWALAGTLDARVSGPTGSGLQSQTPDPEDATPPESVPPSAAETDEVEPSAEVESEPPVIDEPESETPAEAPPAGVVTAPADASSVPLQRVPRDPISYGLWVLAPAVVAILLAILFRQVVPALVVGILVGGYMLIPCLPADDPHLSSGTVLGGIRIAAEKYLIGAVHEAEDANYAHLKIMIFTLVIGFTVGVIGRNGGTAGMVNVVTGRTTSKRRGALTAWLAGMVVFFDDYANAMIVGPTMRSVFDKLKLSRAKLAYIVDSTAAPIASLAIVGTWVGAEIGYIKQGLDDVARSGLPAFLMDGSGNAVTGMGAFIQSLAYRFYPLLALFLVFLIAVSGRDFGPMRRSENRAASRIDPDPQPEEEQKAKGAEPRARWWLGFVPIAALVLLTLGILVQTGQASAGDAAIVNESTPWWARIAAIFGAGDAYISIFYGALAAASLALITTVMVRDIPLKSAVDAGMDGMARMFPAIVILILAWAMSDLLQDMKLGEVVAGQLKAASFPAAWFSTAVFVAAALISFATGSSWATMGILCPMVVTTSARLLGDVDASVAGPQFYGAVGAVLAGAVFGDHCSPISDTTVLSSIASDCPHEEHVWTQLPYALVTALAAIALGDIMVSVYHQPWYYGLGAGAIFLSLVVLIFGRRPKPSLELAY